MNLWSLVLSLQRLQNLLNRINYDLIRTIPATRQQKLKLHMSRLLHTRFGRGAARRADDDADRMCAGASVASTKADYEVI